MAVVDRVRELVAPVVADVGAELYDVEFNGGILRILVDADGGIDIDTIKTISEILGPSARRGRSDPGPYLESPRRGSSSRSTRLHYERAVGETVKIKTFADVDGNRRFTGTLVGYTEAGFMLEIDGDVRAFVYDDVAKARTVFEWGGAPSPARATSVRASQNRREAH